MTVKENPTTITFKHRGEIIEGLVLANKGICWQVELTDGSTILVQKKHVISENMPSAELVDPDSTITAEPFESDEPAPSGSLAEMLTKIRSSGKVVSKQPKQRKAAEPSATSSTTVPLKQLCAELGIEPRVARRRLRNSQGQVGTGHRWEWEADSAELEVIRKAIKG